MSIDDKKSRRYGATAKRRLEARVSKEIHSQIKEAALLSGQTLSGFITTAVTERAEAVVACANAIKLTEAAAIEILMRLDEPPEPSEALLAAARRFRESNIR